MLINKNIEINYSSELINAVENVNDRQKLVISNKVINRFGEDLTGMKFAIWGLSFKPGTDDMREAPSINLIHSLAKSGAIINAYDPQGMENAKILLPNINYSDSIQSSCVDADAIIIATEWNEFRALNFKVLQNQMKDKIIFDLRNIYSKDELIDLNFVYYGIGK